MKHFSLLQIACVSFTRQQTAGAIGYRKHFLSSKLPSKAHICSISSPENGSMQIKPLNLPKEAKQAICETTFGASRAMNLQDYQTLYSDRSRIFLNALLALDQNLYLEEDRLEILRLQEERLETNAAYLEFRRQLASQFPQYYQLKYSSSAITIRRVQQNLSSSELMYSYFWGKENLYVFSPTSRKYPPGENSPARRLF